MKRVITLVIWWLVVVEVQSAGWDIKIYTKNMGTNTVKMQLGYTFSSGWTWHANGPVNHSAGQTVYWGEWDYVDDMWYAVRITESNGVPLSPHLITETNHYNRVANGEGFSHTIAVNLGPATPPTKYLTKRVDNTTQRPRYAWFSKNGVVEDWGYLQPGQSKTHTFQYVDGDVLKWGIDDTEWVPVDGDPPMLVRVTNWNDIDPSIGVTNIAQAPTNTSNTGKAPATDPTGGKWINFSSTNVHDILREGFSRKEVLDDEANKDLLGEAQRIRIASEWMTNEWGKQNMTGGAMRAQIEQYMNRGTNWETAAGLGHGLISGVSNAVVAVEERVGSAPTFPVTGGNKSPFVLELAGYELDIDPESIIPGAMGMVYKLISFVAWLFLLIEGSKAIFASVQAFGTAQTGGVPNIEVLGTNAAGWVASLWVPVVLVMGWATLLAGCVWFFYNASEQWDFVGVKQAVEGLSLPAGTRYLLEHTIPVQLLISFAFLRIGLWLFLSKTVAVAFAVTRFMIGK